MHSHGMRLSSRLRSVLCPVISIISLSSMAKCAMAATFSLNAPGAEPLYRSELPLAVYQYTQRYDLSDMIIRNSAGERLPYALVAESLLHKPSAGNRKVLPFFPLQEETLANTSAAKAGELKLLLEQGTDKTSISITQGAHPSDHSLNTAGTMGTVDQNSGQDSDQASNKDTGAKVFLIDAGEKHAALQSLSLDWQCAEGRLMQLEVLASEDLQSWASVGNAILLKTAHDKAEIKQDTIALRPTQARYLQLRSHGPAPALVLSSVTATLTEKTATPPNLLWQALTARTSQNVEVSASNAGLLNIEFEALGRYPAQWLRVLLAEDNTIASVKISVRNTNDEPWRYLSQASVYRLMQNQGNGVKDRVLNPDIALPTTIARYWQLQFNTNTGGIGRASPQLSLGWPAQNIVWNARGQPPFSLAVGDDAASQAVALDKLIPEFKPEMVMQLPSAAVTWQPTGDNGVGNKQPASTWSVAADHKRWWLWGGLLLGVVILAGMALSLLKPTAKDSAGETAESHSGTKNKDKDKNSESQ